MMIRKFVIEEVARQGWRYGTPAFWFRVGTMMAAWNHALFATIILTEDVVKLWGRMVEPEVNREGWRSTGVQVGGRLCPDAARVPGLMDEWEGHIPHLTPDEVYVEFEHIHPFLDGNGRTGKIIHNFLLGTLRTPVLVKDYFGGGTP